MNKLGKQHLDAIEQNCAPWQREEAAESCTTITIDEMGKFAEWTQDNDCRFNTTVREWQQRSTLKIFTTDQLIQEYIKTI